MLIKYINNCRPHKCIHLVQLSIGWFQTKDKLTVPRVYMVPIAFFGKKDACVLRNGGEPFAELVR